MLASVEAEVICVLINLIQNFFSLTLGIHVNQCLNIQGPEMSGTSHWVQEGSEGMLRLRTLFNKGVIIQMSYCCSENFPWGKKILFYTLDLPFLPIFKKLLKGKNQIPPSNFGSSLQIISVYNNLKVHVKTASKACYIEQNQPLRLYRLGT